MRGVLVTGGAGFAGANFVHYWARRYPEDRLVVLDALTYAGNRDNVAELETRAVRFVHGDIGDQPLVERLLREEGIDVVVHFAAESHVDRSIMGPDAFVQTNIVGTHSLLAACRAVWAERAEDEVLFHHVSTDEVFGALADDEPPFTEQSCYAPNSPYAASKAAADHLVRAYHRTYGLPVTISNCSNNYGPHQYPEKLIPLMLVNALEGRPLPLYGDGSQSRDWLYVEDHCVAVEQIIRHGRRGERYNLGSGTTVTNLELVQRLCGELDARFQSDPALAQRFPRCPAATGRSCAELIAFVADRPGHDRRYAIDASKARREFGFQPREALAGGLRKTISWYLDNEQWWRRRLT